MRPGYTSTRVVCGAVLVLLAAPAAFAAQVADTPDTRGHPALWNQLYETLFQRETPDGGRFGADELDILYWYGTNHLLTEPSNGEAIRVLDRFNREHGEQLVSDPLQRALLQRRLWALFDWAAAPGVASDHAPERAQLERRLAIAIRRLALSAAQIAALPDNYADAVNAGRLAGIPAGLFDPVGNWVTVGTGSGSPLARQHTAAPAFSGRSAFLVMVNLPGGRPRTLAYLNTLDHFQGPLLSSSQQQAFAGGRAVYTLNPALPEFPAGTQWALVRRLCVIDDHGRIQPTSLVESIQLRRYLSVPAVRPSPLSITGFVPVSSRESLQFAEFDMQPRHRAALRAIGPGDSDFTLFFEFGTDPFESMDAQDASRVLANFRPDTLHHCLMCHQSPGIFSVNSYHPEFAFGTVDVQPLQASDESSETRWDVDWKYRQFDWGVLQGLWRGAQ